MSRFFLFVFFPFWLLAPLLFFPHVLEAQTVFDWTLPGDKIEEAEGRGLLIRSNPTGAKVFIDGIERGSTPLRLGNLRAGNYFVRLEKEGYSERSFRARVRAGSIVAVFLELQEATGRLRLHIQPVTPGLNQMSIPLEPRISIDGQSYSQTAMELPVGFRTIQVRAFGWEDFSTTIYIEEDTSRELELPMTPASFRLVNTGINRQRFNPSNAGALGTTVLNFEVTTPGTGSFVVKDKDGKIVFTRLIEPFTTWSQTAAWDGRDYEGEPLGEGIYTLIVEAQSLPWDDSVPVKDSLVYEVVIDSSRFIHPLSASSGRSGLLFAPLPDLLPPGSFQFEGSLLGGDPPVSDRPWKSLPFAVSLRLSPLERLEVSAALNVIPRFGGNTVWGAGGSAKWVFLNPSDSALPLEAAAGFTFSWTGKTALTPFGMAGGFEFFFPFKVNLGNLFSFSLSPAALWTGDEGFPWEPIPRLLVSGGLLMQLTYISAGLSVRSEYNFSGGSLRQPFFIIGGEVKIFPPPSNFVFSFIGGIWIRGSGLGGFGGLGIGMIY